MHIKTPSYHVPTCTSLPNSLVHNLAIEGHTHRAQQEASILIGLAGSMEGDVTTRDHLGRVPVWEERNEKQPS